MLQTGTLSGDGFAYRGGQGVDASHRLASAGAVLALHAAVAAVLVTAQLGKPAPPPERILSVSFISQAPASTAPAPPQPAEPSPSVPQPRLIATPAPTVSAMTSPPVEREPLRETPAPPARPTPQPAAPSTAPSADAAPITPPNFTAAYLNNPGPAYPYASRRKREQGVVRLRVQVGADGAVLQALLERSSGFPELDTAALDVVKRRWRFAPAKQGDRAVSAWVVVPMEFSLKDR